MRSAIFSLIILGALGFSFYKFNESPCDAPFKYSVSRVDSNFGLSREDFQKRIIDAELIWEKVYGNKNLFGYDPNSKFTVNLIYDERQKTVDLKQKTEFGLISAENLFKEKDSAFINYKNEYERKATRHEEMVKEFETASRQYEADVQAVNKKGGANPKEYAGLERRREELNRQIDIINTCANNLKTMAGELNVILEDRNEAANTYNLMVRNYNERYGSGLEFDQAEYVGTNINIYEFKNSEDLKMVLAHELGHAIGMDHTENQNSIMYYLAGADKVLPTSEDKAELHRVCQNTFDRAF